MARKGPFKDLGWGKLGGNKKRTPKKKSPKKKKSAEAGPSVTPVKRARTVATSSKLKKRCLITP